jgi:hypothetical protein
VNFEWVHTGLHPFALLCIQKTKYFSVCIFCVLLRAISRRGAQSIRSSSSVGGFEQCAADGNETQSLQRRCHFLRSLTCIMLTSCVSIYGHCTHTNTAIALQSHRVGTMDARKGRVVVVGSVCVGRGAARAYCKLLRPPHTKVC